MSKELEENKNAQVVIDYIEKYVEKNEKCYEMLTKMVDSPKLENEFTNEQWTYILKQAWQIAYRKAMEDQVLTLEERLELNNINNLTVFYANKPKNLLEFNHRIYNSYRKLHDYGQKDNPYEAKKPQYPKPSPYDNWDGKK